MSVSANIAVAHRAIEHEKRVRFMWVTVTLQVAVTHGTRIQWRKSSNIRWTASNHEHQGNEIMDIQLQKQMGNRNQENNALHILVEQVETQPAELVHSLISRNGSDADADPSIYQGAYQPFIAKGEWAGELPQISREGRELFIEAHWTLVKDDQGQPHSMLAINTDNTDRKKLEAQLFRAQRMESIGTLASGIAHDLNNVLAPILLAVGMLKQQPRSAGEMKMLNLLESSAQHGADLVRQVLTFARGVEGQRQTIDVSRIVNELEKMIRETFDPKIRLSVEIAKDLWPISGDPTELHQSLLNLCVNARDAMPNGGRLQLTVANVILDEQYATMHAQAKAGPYVMIKVSDTGAGIPLSIRDRIFDPFFTTKEVGKGTGLGLATVQAVVRSHGGFLNLYSEEGMGTAFTLYFPGLEGTSAEQAASIEIKLPRGHGELVLVIDDEAAVRTITQQTLEAFGYRVLLAEDGAEALSIYVQHRDEIAVVLTDMMMPVIDGYSTIQALMRINSQVEIIAASGLASHDMVSKAMSAGVKHFIPKPYSAETMLQALAEALGESQT